MIQKNECGNPLKVPAWQYDELAATGVDYNDSNNAGNYDSKESRIRDTAAESANIMRAICLSPGNSILDMGAGTGGFAVIAAEKCARVYAVDPSPLMLSCARKKAESKSIKNIEFVQGGFLTYRHKGAPLDAIVTQFALHHLPDFWKLIALKNMREMLKSGGKLYLADAVYSFDMGAHEAFFEGFLNKILSFAGDIAAKDIENSIRSEYSTFGWIMEGLLKQAGFRIDHAEYSHGMIANYVCTKQA